MSCLSSESPVAAESAPGACRKACSAPLNSPRFWLPCRLPLSSVRAESRVPKREAIDLSLLPTLLTLPESCSRFMAVGGTEANITLSTNSSLLMAPLPSVSSIRKSSRASRAERSACCIAASSTVPVGSSSGTAAAPPTREMRGVRNEAREAAQGTAADAALGLCSSPHSRAPSWLVSMESKSSRSFLLCSSRAACSWLSSCFCATDRTFSTTMPARVFKSMMLVSIMNATMNITKRGLSSKASLAMAGQFSSVANWKSVKRDRGTVPNHSS
mmetsp:Transcript_138862/g.432002  ORF Transcript_138862/g.432002 Transcript_138862/m.432002 type:complete len:272 (+) Transcript_138862:378-1193(+)